MTVSWADPEDRRGGKGSGPPPLEDKNYSFLAILVRTPRKIATKPAFYDGPSFAASERHLNGVSLAGQKMAPLFSGIWILSPPYQLNKISSSRRLVLSPILVTLNNLIPVCSWFVIVAIPGHNH